MTMGAAVVSFANQSVPLPREKKKVQRQTPHAASGADQQAPPVPPVLRVCLQQVRP